MKRVCVFAGSNMGLNPEYAKQARELGRVIAMNGFHLVYGGSKLGLMGEVANGALEQGGHVTGVMPRGLFKEEIAHRGVSDFIEVADMHERKAKMSELSDMYVALPGGYGTFEELFEVICWAQIGIHKKPIGLLNVEGYYDPLLQLIEHTVNSGFMPRVHGQYVMQGSNPKCLLEYMLDFIPEGYKSKRVPPTG
ncbi:TIGR00730 family Rossman fold protein [Priestia endophytica]|uniref:LOG family protein n=1 Tax=Priestia endophytica TaxID=135735 RepID=UPI000DCA621E|nr:TIGR00730 family Rossman fold protein [Priestia endophytica]RAS73853.1 Rossman fold protein, TIGR00730 family [Priestia endophytica]